MDDGVVTIIVSLIGIIAPVFTTIATTRKTRSDLQEANDRTLKDLQIANEKVNEWHKEALKNSSKQTIQILILQDIMNAFQGKAPENFENVLSEYDVYHANGGNSYVTKRVNEYSDWYERIKNKND